MATTDKNTLKQWFSKGAKPLASQFAAWIDAFWHKDEMIPAARIAGLQAALDRKSDREVYYNVQKLPTVKQTAEEFNATKITEPCYVIITDDGTISLDDVFFAGVEPEILFYLKCSGEILISVGDRPEDAYDACDAGTVRALSVYVDVDGLPVITVSEPLLTSGGDSGRPRPF